MRTILTILVVLGMAWQGISQDIQKVAKAKDEATAAALPDSVPKRWFVSGMGALQFSQAAFSNWSSGGQNAIGLNSMVNIKANWSKGKHAWGNTIDLGYGFQYIGKGGDAKYNKTNDKIELTSAYGYQISKNKYWFFTVLVNFRTQFDAGYNYPDDSTVISKFMAPGYLIAGVGITYAPVKWFYVYLSPSSGRGTFVLDPKLSDMGAFGVDSGKQMHAEFGPYLRADMNKDFGKSFNLSTCLELFTNYLEKFGNIDVNWNLLLTLKVNKWLAASVNTQLIYDDDITIKDSPDDQGGPRTQFKEILGIGLSYKFH
jgi:hypothetical protein